MISRTLEAIALGKLIGIASRALGRGGGTALPGLLAQKLDPNLVSYLASQISCGSIMVTGTNGKTTTSRMIASLLRQNQLYPLHNSSGSNLMRGIATTLVEKATWIRSQPFSEESIGLFEVDEATLPQAIAEIKPKMVIITNLFRDQLDRYGEIDAVASRWQETLASLPDTATVVLNSDDPVVASLGENLVANALYYGIEDTTSGHDQMEHAADSRWCPHCAVDYSYLLSYYGHLGHYYCSHCERQRPQPQIKALRLRPKGFAGTEIDLATPTGMTSITIDIPGVYNVYNVLAAVAGAFAWGVPLPIIQKGLQGFTAAFGRGERIKIDNKEICLVLAKNPVGLNEVLRTLSADGLPKGLLLILNDDIADGRDVSWIWDVDFEGLMGQVRFVIASGRRAEDMALRLKYAGLSPLENLMVERDLAVALYKGLEGTPHGETLYVIPTYTALLEVRELLTKKGYLSPFWRDSDE